MLTTPHAFRRRSAFATSLTAFCLAATLTAQGVVPPFKLTVTNPKPSLSAPAVPGTNVQQVHMIHLPSDPPQLFRCSLTVAGLSTSFGGVGGTDLLTGTYDAIADVFTPNAEAAALNTSGTEFGLMLHHTGLYAVFDRLPGNPWLAARATLTQPWQIVGQIGPLPAQGYYDPALADFNGVTQLLHVSGTNIGMTPINLATGGLTGATAILVNPARAGSTANSPTPVLDTAGGLIGLSHHDVLGADNDHYMSLDLDASTPAVLLHDTTTWINNGGFVGGRFFDAESTTPYHVFQIDTYWCTGGRAAIGTAMDVFAYTPPTGGAETYLSFLLLGASYLPAGLPVPPIGGQLGIDVSTLVTLAFPPHNNANGEALLQLAVPNVSFLRGRAIAVQSATLRASTNAITLANTAALSFY